MEPKWTEFSGVAGRVLLKSISVSSLINGMLLGLALIIGDWVLFMAKAPDAMVPFNQILVALALARFAINGLFGEWNGTIFSNSGGPWSMVAKVTLRYLVLTAIWLVPAMLFAPRAGQAPMMSPSDMSGSLIAFSVIYFLAMTLTPPLFLIVALGAETLGEIFNPDCWRRLLAGRKGDLFAIYVVYTGTLGMVLMLAVAPVVLAFVADMKFGFFVAGVTFCLLFGMSANLLGRLCGFFVCGDLGLPQVSTPAAAAPPSVQAPNAPSPASAPVQASVPVSLSEEPAFAAAGKKPPLMESKQRIEVAMKRFATEPDSAISALRDMDETYAVHPHVKQAYAICLYRSGQVDEAMTLAHEALPLCFERGHSYLAAEIFREMRSDLARLDLNREQLVTIGGALDKMNDLSAAAKAFSMVIELDAGEVRAIKGLLKVAGRIAGETSNAAAAAKVYQYLLQHCSASPLVEFMREGLHDVERKLGNVTA